MIKKLEPASEFVMHISRINDQNKFNLIDKKLKHSDHLCVMILNEIN